MTSKLPSWLFLAFSFLLLSGTTSHATPPDPILSSVSQFAGANWGSYPIVHLEAYYAGGVVGGGDFVQKSCTPNLGTCFADNSIHTFQRISPKWDAAEWGALGDHVTDNSAIFTGLIAAAVTAGQYTVTVSQSGQYYFATGFSVPGAVTVKCLSSRSDQLDASSGIPNGDHKTIQYSFLVPAASTITLGVSHATSATLTGCNVINKAVYDTPNPTTLQSMYNITGNGTNTGAFGGVGVTCNGDGCKFEKGLILGFTTGFQVINRDTPQLNEAYIDATNCVDLETTQFVTGLFQNFGCYSLLTNRLLEGIQHLPIDAIAASPATPANYRFHLATPCVTGSGHCPLTGNIVWIGQPVGGAQPLGVESSAGRCTVKYIDDSNFECTNTQTTATVTTGTTVLGSVRICSVGNLTYVRQFQQVSGTGIPGSDTVVAVAPREGCVWLAAAATASGAIANLTFTDNAYSGADLYNLRPFANNRFGTGILLNDAHSFKMSACEVYTHDTGVLINNGSDGITITGCGMHNESSDLDSTAIGLDFDGSAKGNYWAGGTIDYGGNQGTSILNNQNAGSVVSPNYVASQEVGQGNDANIVIDNLAGNLVADISTGSNAVQGDIFVSDASRTLVLDHFYGQGTTVRTQSGVAESHLSGCNTVDAAGSVYCNPGSAINVLTAFAGGGQASATRTSSDYVRVNGVATVGDSIMLRPAIAGRHQVVTNAAAKSMQVFGYVVTADTINGIASATGISQPPGSTWDYVSTVTGASYVNQGLPVYGATGTRINGHLVSGAFTLSGGTVTITLTNDAVFTSNATYACNANDNTGTALAASTVNVSGTQFTVKGTGTDTGTYLCVGN